MDPIAQSSNASGSHERRAFPGTLIALSIIALLFELMVALGVIMQPIPGLGGPISPAWMAAALAGVIYCTLTVVGRPQHPFRLSDTEVPLIFLLMAQCSGGFAQLTTVLVPRTILRTAAEIAAGALPLGETPSASSANTIHFAMLILAAGSVAIWLAHCDNAANRLRILLYSTLAAAILCIGVPVASSPFWLKLPKLLSLHSAAAAAITPARMGAVSFPLLWVAIVAIDSIRTPGDVGRAGLATRLAPTLAVPVVGVLAYLSEPKPLLAISLALGIGVLAQLPNLVGPLRSARLSGKAEASAFSLSDIGLICVFFLSGMAALVYQVVFAKGLALTFGSTSHASTIVLATYMSGLALGSWLGGRYAERVTRPVLLYACAELGIALICVFAPVTLKLTRAAYVMIASGADPAQGWLVGLQLGLGAVVLIPPTLLMGVTLPMLTRHLIDRRGSLGVSAGVLYSSNTLGAAAGALTTGYLLMPVLGVSGSLFIAVGLNVLVAGIALILGKGRNLAPRSQDSGVGEAVVGQSFLPEGEDIHRVLGFIALAQLTIGGFVTFGLETTFVHLLATIAGNSAYAFSLMLFAFLIGLGAGSNVARRWLRANRDYANALLICQASLALTLLIGVPFWDAIPKYFALFGTWAPARTFAARELIRFLACLVIMLPPALCIGAQFPIAMEVVGRAWVGRRIAALGFASALNTLGNILGALVVGFVFLPQMGSLSTLHLLIVSCLFLAGLSVPYTARKLRPSLVGLLLVEIVLFLKQPSQFDLTALASGGNVYFHYQHYGRVIDSAESLDGGLTTVAVSGENHSWSVLTLLTNGKFQGDDSKGGEMKAQSSFALAPLLHTSARNRALVIGFGTGTTTKVFHQAGFRHIDVAELSGDILTLADRHFRVVNEGVLHQAEVKAHVTDGRNFLLLDQSKYDVVSIELSSIWFAGAANLYNKEFYKLVHTRLAAGGVLQQWVQLHRLLESDIATILTTLEDEFPNVWLYFLGKQGILVACVDNCAPNKQTLSVLDQSIELSSTLKLFDGHAAQVLKGRILTPISLRRLVQDARGNNRSRPGLLVATDDNLTLEYSTPKGNVRKYDESLDQNLRYLDHYKVGDIFESTSLTSRDAPYLSE